MIDNLRKGIDECKSVKRDATAFKFGIMPRTFQI
jgi:hypothetical protein